MKRSQIDRYIDEAIGFFRSHQFPLPPFAYWTETEWRAKGAEYDEIRDNMLGWDLTDFGGGDFEKQGLLLFTIRNGSMTDPRYGKPYAEKIGQTINLPVRAWTTSGAVNFVYEPAEGAA